MQSVRIQLTVDSEMSLEFARLDMSKLVTVTGNCHGERNCAEPRCPEPTCRALARKRKLGECGVTGRRGVRVNATKSRRWRPRERLPAPLCSDPHSRRSPGVRWSEPSEPSRNLARSQGTTI